MYKDGKMDCQNLFRNPNVRQKQLFFNIANPIFLAFLHPQTDLHLIFFLSKINTSINKEF